MTYDFMNELEISLIESMSEDMKEKFFNSYADAMEADLRGEPAALEDIHEKLSAMAALWAALLVDRCGSPLELLGDLNTNQLAFLARHLGLEGAGVSREQATPSPAKR